MAHRSSDLLKIRAYAEAVMASVLDEKWPLDRGLAPRASTIESKIRTPFGRRELLDAVMRG